MWWICWRGGRTVRIKIIEIRNSSMGISKPYRRTARLFTDDKYSLGGKSQYILHKDYAQSPDMFVKAFLLIQEDFLSLLKYVETADINLKTYSHRIHELLLRTCVEVEANLKAILRENNYSKTNEKDWNMKVYNKIEKSHYLSQYEVKIPHWKGSHGIRKPFKEWENDRPLGWYQDYNLTKHDRHSNFEKANFEKLIDALTGLTALISSQFLYNSFTSGPTRLVLSPQGPSDDFEETIGNYFRIKYPSQIPDNEKYSFEYKDIDFTKNIFQDYPYT